MGSVSETSPVVALAFRLFLREPFVQITRWPLLRNDKDAPVVKGVSFFVESAGLRCLFLGCGQSPRFVNQSD